ncbi:metallophosphoesterase family protein [Metabacillus sediminilitoris]|uniref:Phosphatase n=1 Tax=Metabacillus sediminilitoris TaxID=2567941 RepID=A0A4S4BLN0_9BACI|nr:metallophosphoesterase [Metabacillus sediminilitoris]QGQ45600.1 phosphatase [Metabacillus sediminilitoris]THF75689.1 phosphatase [Metabacillus sediminilitoris]
MKDKQSQNETENLLSTDIFKNEMDRRTFLQRSSKVAGAALGLTLIGSLNSIPVGAVSSSSVIHSNGRKPDLVFPVISDVHIHHSNDNTLNKFITTLEQLNKVVPSQDAFVVVGDLTDYGYESEYDKFMSAYNKRKQSKAVSMFAIGNHDYWNGLSVNDSYKRFYEKTGMDSHYYHKVIKGYHFIVLGTEDGRTEGTFSVKQIEWLGEQLKLAKADDPNKPIFVFHHQPIKETIYGSEWGFTENRDLFYDTLKPYPQVISFSGHTHYPLDDPRIIHQKDFTSIGTSTGAYLWLDSGRVQGEVPEGADILNQALVVEVHNNKVLIKRRDIHNDDWTGEPFEISYPAEKNKFKYTEDRDNKAPFFTKDAMISIDHEKTAVTSLAIMLTQAKDNLLVHDYRVVARNADTGEVVNKFLAFSEFYKDPVPNPLTLSVGELMPNTTYQIEVYALDAYENVSHNSLKVLGKTLDGEVKDVMITLSKDILKGVEDSVEVTVENARIPKSDWIGLYEVNEKPGDIAAIWWMYTQTTNGTLSFTFNGSSSSRYKEGSTYKFVYFYGSGYDAVASKTFTVGS